VWLAIDGTPSASVPTRANPAARRTVVVTLFSGISGELLTVSERRADRRSRGI